MSLQASSKEVISKVEAVKRCMGISRISIPMVDPSSPRRLLVRQIQWK